MSDSSLSRAATWRAAAKPASWPKLLVPFVLGQAIGVAATSRPCWTALAVGLVFTVLDLLFIVFLNDWGDREVDALKRRMFPSSSPKTIPDGLLPAHHLLFAGVLAGVAALTVAGLGALWLERPWLLPLAALALAIFSAYSLPPLRLNYRGGGEALEMLGVGVALPWTHAYLQSGELWADGLWLLPGFTLMSLGSAIASGLSDERSDRRGGKRTFVTAFGNRVGRRAAEACVFGGALVWALTGLYGEAIPAWVALPASGLAVFHAGAAAGLSSAAGTDAFSAQRSYKAQLHHAIWRGGVLASMLLASWFLWFED